MRQFYLKVFSEGTQQETIIAGHLFIWDCILATDSQSFLSLPDGPPNSNGSPASCRVMMLVKHGCRRIDVTCRLLGFRKLRHHFSVSEAEDRDDQ